MVGFWHAVKKTLIHAHTDIFIFEKGGTRKTELGKKSRRSIPPPPPPPPLSLSLTLSFLTLDLAFGRLILCCNGFRCSITHVWECTVSKSVSNDWRTSRMALTNTILDGWRSFTSLPFFFFFHGTLSTLSYVIRLARSRSPCHGLLVGDIDGAALASKSGMTASVLPYKARVRISVDGKPFLRVVTRGVMSTSVDRKFTTSHRRCMGGLSTSSFKRDTCNCRHVRQFFLLQKSLSVGGRSGKFTISHSIHGNVANLITHEPCTS